MAVFMVLACGLFLSHSRASTHSRSSRSRKRHNFRFPSPSGCAGTYPRRAQRMRVRLRAICEAATREYGMPARIRTDDGAPFAGTGLLGLSKLSLGWMKLGIVHERIQAGRPQQSGRHERVHRTLKEDTTKPPAASLRAQQGRFDNFRYVFNNERPHEGLNNQVPASLYIPSAIRLPRKLPEFRYPKGLQLRRVNNSGDISWHKNRIFISEVFRFEELGVELITSRLYRVFFRDMEIGQLNSEELLFRAARRVLRT
jgi:hypothetical protein